MAMRLICVTSVDAEDPVVWAIPDTIMTLVEEYPAAVELAEAIAERLEPSKSLA